MSSGNDRARELLAAARLGRRPAHVTMPARTENTDPLHDFCRSLPGVTEDIKWGNDQVFSVQNKMFASFSVPEGEPFSFKVDPLVLDDLTQRPGIEPAHYLEKHHRISVHSRDVLPLEVVKIFLGEAHASVASKLSKKARISLGIE